MPEERQLFEETLNEEIERLLDLHLAEEGIYRLREELNLIVKVTLRIPPDSVKELNTLARAYVQGNKGQDDLLKALEAFLGKIPPEAVNLLTEQRNGTGSLMSKLRKNIEKRRRFIETRRKAYK